MVAKVLPGFSTSSRVRVLMRACGGAACLFASIAVIAMIGWQGVGPAPHIWGNSYFASVSRLLLGLILISFTLPGCDRLRWARVLLSSLIIAAGTISAFSPRQVGSPLYIPTLSASTLILFSFASLLLESRRELARGIVPWLALGGVLLNSVTLLGYLYKAGLLYGGATGTVGIVSAATGLLLGIGLLAAAGPARVPLRLVIGDSITSQMLRSLLPATCVAMLLGEIVSDAIRGTNRGDAALSDALQTFFSTAFITGIVLFLARRVGQKLERAEKERDRAEAAVSASNLYLAQMIGKRTDELERVRREVEHTLLEHEARNTALLSALPDWIFRVENDGTILDFRCPPDQSDVPASEVHAALARKISDWVRQNLQMCGRDTVDFNFPGATYEARFVRTTESQILAIVRDISELARLEREVLDANVREQRRIGEELHDGLGQQLTAVGFMSKILELELGERNMPQAAQAAEIGRQVSATIGTIRTLARGLFRYDLGSHSLVDALQELTSAADANFRVECTLQADRSIVLPDRAADLHLYRISQEAVVNAIKHGHANRIHIELKRDGSKIVFKIEDNGNGAAVRGHENGAVNGIGLRTMEFRTRRLGGRFGIESRPGKGTVVTCVLPDTCRNTNSECQPQKQLLLLP